MTDEHEHAMKVWWEAFAATGNFVRFNSKSEKAAAAVIAADRAGLVARIAELEGALRDPDIVHVNMLRGSIARPSPAAIWHIYQGELLDAMPSDYRAALKDTRHD